MNKIKYLQFIVTLLICLSVIIYYINKNNNKLLTYIVFFVNQTNNTQNKTHNKLDTTNIKIDSLHMKIDFIIDKVYDMQDNLDTLKKETRKLNINQKKMVDLYKNHLPCPR